MSNIISICCAILSIAIAFFSGKMAGSAAAKAKKLEEELEEVSEKTLQQSEKVKTEIKKEIKDEKAELHTGTATERFNASLNKLRK